MAHRTVAFILIHNKIKVLQGGVLLKNCSFHMSVILGLLLGVELLLQRPQRPNSQATPPPPLSHFQQSALILVGIPCYWRVSLLWLLEFSTQVPRLILGAREKTLAFWWPRLSQTISVFVYTHTQNTQKTVYRLSESWQSATVYRIISLVFSFSCIRAKYQKIEDCCLLGCSTV
jgi:hypothetical protein